MSGFVDGIGGLSIQDMLALAAAFFSGLAFVARWRTEREEHEALIGALLTIADRLLPASGAPASEEDGLRLAMFAGRRRRIRPEQVYGVLAFLSLMAVAVHAMASGRP